MSSEGLASASNAKGGKCTEHFFYYNNRKAILGTVSTSTIIIGFVAGTIASEKEAFLASHATYIKGKEAYETLDETSSEIIDLQPGLTCKQVEELLSLLQQNDLVQFANPTFLYDEDFKGIGGQFIVTLKENSTYAQLESLVNKTNTRIVGEISPDLKIYIIEADKNSKGNSLDMANFFHKQAIVQNAEPDFVLQSPGIGIGTW